MLSVARRLLCAAHRGSQSSRTPNKLSDGSAAAWTVEWWVRAVRAATLSMAIRTMRGAP